MAKSKTQINEKDQKWANKSWKPFLWMVIGGTVLAIIGIVLIFVPVFMLPGTSEPGTAAAATMLFIIFGYILAVLGGLVCDGGIALIIVTIIKSNKAKARLGLKK